MAFEGTDGIYEMQLEFLQVFHLNNQILCPQVVLEMIFLQIDDPQGILTMTYTLNWQNFDSLERKHSKNENNVFSGALIL